MSERKPSTGFWVTIVVFCICFGYPLLFGPVCWMSQRTGVGNQIVSTVYRPILALASEQGELPEPTFWYARIGTRDDDVPIIRGGALCWRNEWERRIISRLGFHHGPFPPEDQTPDHDASDAPIICWIDPVGKRVWIRGGEADRVQPGTIYVVLKRRQTPRDPDQPESELDTAGIKARVEVTRVCEPNLLEARILEEAADAPIARRDPVVSQQPSEP